MDYYYCNCMDSGVESIKGRLGLHMAIGRERRLGLWSRLYAGSVSVMYSVALSVMYSAAVVCGLWRYISALLLAPLSLA